MIFRHPTAEDGAAIWRIVRDSGVLDVNSSYAYLMMGQYFGATCMVAEDETAESGEDRLAGFVIGFRPPSDPEALFVWQVAVDSAYRGQGIASRMLRSLLNDQPAAEVRFLEATISPSNAASQALFCGTATHLNTDCSVTDLFPAEWFPADGDHEPEQRYRIGPFSLPLSTNK